MFDWTTVPVSAMAVCKTGGVYRQTSEIYAEADTFAVWLKELWAWGYDSLTLTTEAEAYLDRMENAHLVLLKHDVFERAACGLENEAGHMHTRYCAGPSATARQVQRRLNAMVARRTP